MTLTISCVCVTVIRINFVRKNFVRNFRVTIFSFISNAHHIFTVYNITSKQISCNFVQTLILLI